MSIRLATPEDAEAVIDLASLMHDESHFASFDFSREKLQLLFNYLVTDSNGLVLVAEEDGEIYGMFCGLINEFFFGGDTTAQDLALYVKPEKRQGTTGLKLLREYIQWARSKNVAQIQIANSTGIERDRVAKLFERLNFKHVGYVFVQNLKE